MPRSRFTRSSICTLLGVVLVLAYFTATPARAGRDQLWFTDHVTSDGTRADIRSILNGNCLDASGASAANGTRIQAWECKVQDASGHNPVGWAQAWNQRWRINDPNSGGYWAGACDARGSIDYQGQPYCGLEVVNGDYSDRLWFSIAVGDNWARVLTCQAALMLTGKTFRSTNATGLRHKCGGLETMLGERASSGSEATSPARVPTGVGRTGFILCSMIVPTISNA